MVEGALGEMGPGGGAGRSILAHIPSRKKVE